MTNEWATSGVGWTLGIKNVRLESQALSAVTGKRPPKAEGLITRYCLRPTRPHLITITFPDGKVYKFLAGTDPQCQTLSAIRQATVTYSQEPGTTGTAGASLVALGSNDVIVDGGISNPSKLGTSTTCSAI